MKNAEACRCWCGAQEETAREQRQMRTKRRFGEMIYRWVLISRGSKVRAASEDSPSSPPFPLFLSQPCQFAEECSGALVCCLLYIENVVINSVVFILEDEGCYCLAVFVFLSVFSQSFHNPFCFSGFVLFVLCRYICFLNMWLMCPLRVFLFLSISLWLALDSNSPVFNPKSDLKRTYYYLVQVYISM